MESVSKNLNLSDQSATVRQNIKQQVINQLVDRTLHMWLLEGKLICITHMLHVKETKKNELKEKYRAGCIPNKSR